MKERPILFSGPMVRAILEGRKTQTRRVIKPQPHYPIRITEDPNDRYEWKNSTFHSLAPLCPYGKAGDRLWVRENHCFLDVEKSAISQFPLGPENNNELGPDVWNLVVEYSDGRQRDHSVEGNKPKQTRFRGEEGWRPSIHMPRWASRLTLELTDVGCHRLHDLTDKDAIAEGIRPHLRGGFWYRDHDPANADDWDQFGTKTARSAFEALWQSINGAESWYVNPWVWVVKFKVVA